ncbi:MAG: tripartite tricarboxylate transporter substrate binding protein [Proteobacteria bacterium]|nr:tripartite tricarboxylate transporter substrate binding protein [Burkholderiales bacterium]
MSDDPSVIDEPARSRRRLLQALAGVACGALARPVLAQSAYPVRAIRLVVAFGAGGIADTIARTLSVRLSERLGQQVIVDNRPGAGGALGAKIVTAAQPDGHTLLVTTAAISVNANVSKDAVDPVNALMPIVNAASTPTIFAVHGSNPTKGLMDFVKSAKAGRFTFATAGVGTTEHLTAEFVFRPLSGIEPVHVPYAGGIAPVSATVAQQVDMAVTTIPTAFGQIKGNALRVLAVAARTRMPLLPDVPTLREAGFAEFENSSWIGVFGPPKLPVALGRRLNEEVNLALKLPEVRERLVTLGFDPRGGAQDAFAGYVKSEVEKWGRVIKATGITPA